MLQDALPMYANYRVTLIEYTEKGMGCQERHSLSRKLPHCPFTQNNL